MGPFVNSLTQILRPRIFVSYHHGGDGGYYEEFSRHFHDTHETIFDNSLERRIDSDNPDYVRGRISTNFIKGSSCTFVLVGRNTRGRKYVDWEIDATLEQKHALIGVQLPSLPIKANNTVDVPDRLVDNIQSGYALWLTWQQIVSNPRALADIVALAKDKSSTLIRNGRERRLRNASLV